MAHQSPATLGCLMNLFGWCRPGYIVRMLVRLWCRRLGCVFCLQYLACSGVVPLAVYVYGCLLLIAHACLYKYFVVTLNFSKEGI